MMTIDEQRIKVLEWMGWKVVHSYGHSEFATADSSLWHLCKGDELVLVFPWHDFRGPALKDCLNQLPQFTLDWVHEAWIKLSPAQKKKYLRILSNLLACGFANIYNILDLVQMEDATAEQRLAALVETIKGK